MASTGQYLKHMQKEEERRNIFVCTLSEYKIVIYFRVVSTVICYWEKKNVKVT